MLLIHTQWYLINEGCTAIKITFLYTQVIPKSEYMNYIQIVEI